MSQDKIYELLTNPKGKQFTFNEILESLDIGRASCYQNLKRMVRRGEVKSQLIETPDRKCNYHSVYWVED